MTIAACYVSPEGIVFGADSTSTIQIPGNPPHYLNNNQKLFEIGEGGTLGVLTWGLGGLEGASYRTLIALLADDLAGSPPTDVADVANRWCAQFWNAYFNSPIRPFIDRCRALNLKQPFDPGKQPADPNDRTQAEEGEFLGLMDKLTVGFCIGGYVAPRREPTAFQIVFNPMGQPVPDTIPMNTLKFWGAPNIFLRLIRGCDDFFRTSILTSGKWAGTAADLDALIIDQTLSHPLLPIRDAIDYTHACIATTIKAFKFSQLSQICGGPIELAVVTTDRKFRWVRHKSWEIGITEGDP